MADDLTDRLDSHGLQYGEAVYYKAAKEIRALRAQVAALQAEKDDAREELAAVLSDWNALVAAIGSPTHGGAVGHARQVVAERDALQAEVAAERARADMHADLGRRTADALGIVGDRSGMPEAAAALRAERDSLRAGLDAALDFAGTVAGGASWWDDVWAEHAARIDAARDAKGGSDAR